MYGIREGDQSGQKEKAGDRAEDIPVQRISGAASKRCGRCVCMYVCMCMCIYTVHTVYAFIVNML